MTAPLGAVIPFWLDRPAEEAVAIATEADRAGLESLWVGELASFDAPSLATAIGLRTERLARPAVDRARAADARDRVRAVQTGWC